MPSDPKTPSKQIIPKSPSDGWQQRITIPTILAGIAGGLFGLVSKSRRPLAVSYAANLAIVTGCYCGARELARDARASEPDDLINSVIGGVASGGLLGKLQGGQLSAIRYAVIFATVGTAFDFTTLELRPYLRNIQNSVQEMSLDPSSWSLPEWSPIQILDEEALAAKRAREQQLYEQRRFGTMNKEKS
ncbi:uncharacterized protein A4U43_C09F11120 [Asparagus officinalis]|uniref:Uncharacterized protein n=1 Tax=Asparagus officinalis TaxID=4686 RepID=A0A5P1E6R5_ASPOF|nr:uncharacterized protein LOC109824334 [Asparagus officinalis]ONK58332.1 uncharacterized protein A4U43_C09F11120 [Asparagus officinalis]